MTDKSVDQQGEELISKYILGCISKSEFQELQELLLNHTELRERLCREIELDSLLHIASEQDLDEKSDLSIAPTEHPIVVAPADKTTLDWHKRTIAVLATSCVVLFGFCLHAWSRINQGKQFGARSFSHKKITLTSVPVGMLSSWGYKSSTGKGTQQKPVEAEAFHFDMGLHELVLSSGGRLTIAAPAEFELKSPELVHVKSGRMRVACIGSTSHLQVVTPNSAIKISEGVIEIVVVDEVEELHVLEGTAEISARDTNPSEIQPRTVTAKNAVKCTQSGQFISVDFSPSDQIKDERTSLISGQYLEDFIQRSKTNWTNQSAALQKDHRVLTYFDFQRKGGVNTLPNLASLGTGSPGFNFGGEWSEGRWPWKQALDFKRLDQYVNIDVSGSHRKLTLFASLRVDRLDWPFQAIVNSDDWSSRRFHWQLRNDTPGDGVRLELGVSTDSGDGEPFVSPPIINESNLGRWITVATTINCDTGLVKHYLDGELVSSLQMENKDSIRINRARIGNSISYIDPKQPGKVVGDARFDVRPLNGRIDELVIFKNELKPKEIKELSNVSFSNNLVK